MESAHFQEKKNVAADVNLRPILQKRSQASREVFQTQTSQSSQSFQLTRRYSTLALICS